MAHDIDLSKVYRCTENFCNTSLVYKHTLIRHLVLVHSKTHEEARKMVSSQVNNQNQLIDKSNNDVSLNLPNPQLSTSPPYEDSSLRTPINNAYYYHQNSSFNNNQNIPSTYYQQNILTSNQHQQHPFIHQNTNILNTPTKLGNQIQPPYHFPLIVDILENTCPSKFLLPRQMLTHNIVYDRRTLSSAIAPSAPTISIKASSSVSTAPISSYNTHSEPPPCNYLPQPNTLPSSDLMRVDCHNNRFPPLLIPQHSSSNKSLIRLPSPAYLTSSSSSPHRQCQSP